MHKLLRTGILITFGMLIICIIGGCGDDDLTREGEVKLLATIPENGGTVSATGELRMVFDSFPKSVTVDGKEVIIVDNTAIVQIADLLNIGIGSEKTVIISWVDPDNSFIGTQMITFTILKPVTVIVINHGQELTLEFSEEVKSVKVNGRSAMGSGRDWMVWSDHGQYGHAQFLNIEWTNQDGSTDTMEVGPYDIIFDDGGKPPVITSATVIDGEVDVDPAPINAGGFRFDFDEPVIGDIVLTDEGGVDLNWQAKVSGRTATLTPIAGQELVNGTIYKIEFDITDGSGDVLALRTITFVTKPK